MPTENAAIDHYRRSAEQASKLGIHNSAIIRWIQRGKKLPNGGVIRLEGQRRPSGWYVSDDALERFFSRLTEVSLAPTGADRSSPTTSSAVLSSRALRAERELTAAGV